MLEIKENLKELKLHYLVDNWSDFINGAQELPLEKAIEKVVELELMEKSRRGLDRRLKAARLGNFSKMSDFDWNWPKEYNGNKVRELLETSFVKDHKNVILAGSAGLGKTMIAKNIAWNCVIKGYSALYTTASKMVIDLGAQESSVALKRALQRYAQANLLVIDEIGYLSFDTKAADLLFEVVNQRYEQGSIIMTTNLGFKDWYKVFPGAPCLTAMVDRLTHHAEIIKLTGDSYRKKSRKDSEVN